MDGPDSTADKTDGSFGGPSDVASGDNHGVDSVQSLARAMSAEQQARRRTDERLASLELQWQLVAVSLSGLSALQDVIPIDRFVLGRALGVCAWSRLLERLRVCPPRSTRHMTTNKRAGTRGLLFVEVDATRLAMEQLVHQRELVCTTALHQRSGATTRSVEVAHLGAIAHALGMSPSVLAAAKVRHFERKNGHVLTRLSLEQHMHSDGRMFFVLRRDRARSEVRVAVRATEEWDDRNRRFVSSLEEEWIPYAVVPALPEAYPGGLVWRESRAAREDGRCGAGDAAGRLLVSVPVSVVQGKAWDVAALL